MSRPEDSCTKRILSEKKCRYVGSIAVPIRNQDERQKFINEKFREMKDVVKGIPVVLVITGEGIMVLKGDKTIIKMAHGVTRIILSTCQPEHKLFAYVAKTVTSDQKSVVQAHIFKTKKISDTKELNASLSKAFKIAADSRHKGTKTFDVETAQNRETEIKGKRWAKQELARGHEHALHAQQAQQAERRGSQPNASPNKNVPSSTDIVRANSDKTSPKHIYQRLGDGAYSDIDFYEQPVDSCRATLPTDHRPSLSSHLPGQLFSSAIMNRPLPALPSSFDEQDLLNRAEWYQIGYTREIAESILINRPIGSFFIRKSKAQVGSFVLTVRIPTSVKPTGMGNFIIEQSEGRYRLKEFTSNFSTLTDLVRHYSSCREDIPVQLHLDSDETFRIASQCQVGSWQCQVANRKVESDLDEEMAEDEILKNVDWYEAGYSRDMAEAALSSRSVGSFIIRKSQTQPGLFVMTVKVPTSIKPTGSSNYLIEVVDHMYKLKEYAPTFSSLTDLVGHYGSVKEDIPVQLNLGSDNLLCNISQQNEASVYDSILVDSNSNAPVSGYYETAEDIKSDECIPPDPIYGLYESCDAMVKELDECVPSDPVYGIYESSDPIAKELNECVPDF